MTKKEAIIIGSQRGFTHTQTLVYSVLAKFSGKDDMCAIPYKIISEHSEITINSVKSCLKTLETAGHLGIIRSSYDVNTYVLLREIGSAVPISSPYGRYKYLVRHGSDCTLISNERQLKSLRKHAISYCKVV